MNYLSHSTALSFLDLKLKRNIQLHQPSTPTQTSIDTERM